MAQGTAKKKGRPTKAQAERKRREEQNTRAQQRRAERTALWLLALGILLTALALITGESVWSKIHAALFGVFGVLAYAAGPFCLWFAVAYAFGKTPAAPTVAKGVALYFSISGAIYIFGGYGVGGVPFAESVKRLYLNCASGNDKVGGGAASALLGWALERGCGDTAAKVVIVALIFLLVMLLSGKTVVDLVNSLRKPVDAIAEKTAQARENSAAQDAAAPDGTQPRRGWAGFFGPKKDKSFDIDVPLAEAAPPDPAKGYAEPTLEEQVSTPETKPETPQPKVELPPIDFSEQAKQEAAQKANSLPVHKRTPSSPIDIPLGPEFDPATARDDDDLDGVIVNKHKIAVGPAASVVDEVYRRQETMDEMFTDFSAPAPQQSLEDLVRRAATAAAQTEAAGAAAPAVPAAQEQQPVQPAPAEAQPVPEYKFPPISLLDKQKVYNDAAIDAELRANADAVVSTLESFGVNTRVLDISRGPSVTRYELQPEAGVRLSRIVNLADDLALNLAAEGVRIEAPIPGKAAVGVEVPNKTTTIVNLRSVIESDIFRKAEAPLTFAIGKDIGGQVRIGDISKMPHLLIAGSTGMGKSVCINSMIVSLVYKSSPKDLQLILVDPKMVEFTCYAGLPHLYIPVVTDPKKAAGALGSAVGEMLKRYKLFSTLGVRNIEEYNAWLERRAKAGEQPVDGDGEPLEKKPRLVIIIDELADLMMTSPTEVEDAICRLAQMGRASGIHLVVATQRPSVDVITGTIKNNIPSRIAFKVSSQVDSRTILDGAGAEKLIGRGDMLFQLVGKPKPVRIQGSYVSDEEVARVVAFLKQYAVASYNEQFIQDMEANAAREKGKGGGSDGDEDPLLEDAIEVVVEAGVASTSLLQRRLKLGYARAARIMDDMEVMGIVGPSEGSKPRAVKMTRQMWQEREMRKADTAES